MVRDIGRRAHFNRGVALTLAAASVGGAGLAAAPGAGAAALPPKVTSAFTPNLIGVGDSTATAFSITVANPNASGTLTSVGLTDTLPAGLTVDDPNGENGTCGSTSVVTANAGSSTISLSGGSVGAGASCTFSVSVIASQTGALQNSTGAVSSSAGSAAADTETLTVLPPPTVTAGGIRSHARYAYGQVVRPRYTCAQPSDAGGLTDCSAADDLGNAIASGGALKTKAPGSHSLTISATSVDGLVTTDTIDYTVLPDNRFTLSRVRPSSGGGLGLRLALPGAGRLVIAERSGRVTVGSYTRRLTAARRIAVTLRPTAAGQGLVSAGSTRVTLTVTFTPTGGVRRTLTKRGIVLS